MNRWRLLIFSKVEAFPFITFSGFQFLIFVIDVKEISYTQNKQGTNIIGLTRRVPKWICAAMNLILLLQWQTKPSYIFETIICLFILLSLWHFVVSWKYDVDLRCKIFTWTPFMSVNVATIWKGNTSTQTNCLVEEPLYHKEVPQ